MTRERLPNRRAAMTIGIEHGGQQFTVTVGFYPDNRPGEVFTHGIKTGSSLDALLADACVLVSVLMQHGITPVELASSTGRQGGGGPASVIGAVLDLLASAAASATQPAGAGA
jgi:hypothetical protein